MGETYFCVLNRETDSQSMFGSLLGADGCVCQASRSPIPVQLFVTQYAP